MDPYDRILEAAQSERAPHALRERIDAAGDRTLVRRMVVRRMKLTGALMAAAAVLGVVVGLAASGGGGSAPSALEAAAPGALAPTAGAPAIAGDTLTASVDGVAFPRWPGWSASGQRADEISGRRVRTVFYERDGVRVGYTIVAGDPLPWPEGERRTSAGGTEVRTLRRSGRVLVVWREGGHTCIVSAPATVPTERLLGVVDYA